MFPLFLSIAAATALPVVPPAGVYRYEAFVSGKIAGKAAVTVSSLGAGIKLDERSETRTPTGTSSATSTTVLDAALLPTAYHGTYVVLDQKMDATVTFNDRTATVTAGTDSRAFPMGGSSKLFVIVDSALVSGFFILPAQMNARANADITVLTPGSGGSGFLSVIGGDHPLRPADVPTTDASISFAGDAPCIEWYDPKTFVIDEVLVPGQALVLKRRR